MTHTKDEALKLALEALFTYEEEWPDDGQGGLNFQVAYDQNKVFAAITAIKQALAASVQEPVRWSDYEPDGRRYPAVPDAFGTREGEHPQYIQGWNDCRAEIGKAMP